MLNCNRWLILLAFLLPCACQQKNVRQDPVLSDSVSEESTVKPTVQVSVLRSSSPVIPGWATYKWKLQNKNNPKILFVTLVSSRPSLNSAVFSLTNSADWDKSVSERFVAIADEYFDGAMGDFPHPVARQDYFYRYYQSQLHSLPAKYVWELRPTGEEYWEQIYETEGDLIRVYYRFFKHYSLDYEQFKQNILTLFADSARNSPALLREESKILYGLIEKYFSDESGS